MKDITITIDETALDQQVYCPDLDCFYNLHQVLNSEIDAEIASAQKAVDDATAVLTDLQNKQATVKALKATSAPLTP